MMRQYLYSVSGVFGLWCMLVAGAHAHGVLTESVPEDGATVSAPETLELNFNEPVRLLRLALSDGEGEAVDFGFSPVADAREAFDYELPSLPSGEYRVNWVVIGSDGHRVEETFGFAVRAVDAD